MKQKNIYDHSLIYESLKQLLRFIFPKFHRTYEVKGLENIPDHEPIIFAGNHQLGLIDPLAIILAQKEPIVYMARADIFQNKMAAWFLKRVKITPVYRIRDGYENLSRNEKQLKIAVEVLRNRKRLGVMPEGNHGAQHRLRPMVKGLFRIAFLAEKELMGTAHVKIIPVGIDHSKYQQAGADLIVQFGKPIEVSEFMEVYNQNPAIGLNNIKDKLATELSDLMLDIQSEPYDLLYELSCYGASTLLEKDLTSSFKSIAGKRFEARVKLSKRLNSMAIQDPKQIEQLEKLTHKLKQLPGSPNEIAEYLDQHSNFKNDFASVIAGFMALPGMLLNFPSWILNRAIMVKVEDKQMYQTFALTIGLLFNACFYPSVTLMLAFFWGFSVWRSLVLFLMVCTIGLASENYRQSLRMYWKLLPHRFGSKRFFLLKCRADYQEFKQHLATLLMQKDASNNV